MIDDVITMSKAIHAAHPTLPRLLFGHSMGGCISLAVCIQEPTLFQYAVFSAPTTSRPPSVNAFLKAMGGIVATVGPRLRLTSLDKATLSRNTARVQAYHADPLVWRQSIAAGFGYDILVVGDKLIEDAHLFITPCMIMSGTYGNYLLYFTFVALRGHILEDNYANFLYSLGFTINSFKYCQLEYVIETRKRSNMCSAFRCPILPLFISPIKAPIVLSPPRGPLNSSKSVLLLIRPTCHWMAGTTSCLRSLMENNSSLSSPPGMRIVLSS